MARMTAFDAKWLAEDLAEIVAEATKECPNRHFILATATGAHRRFLDILAQDIEIEPAPVRVAGGAQS